MRGEIVGQRLYGDLAIVGSGDPTISGRYFEGDPLAPMRDWARRLRELGIEEIFGRVFLVHGAFDDERIHRIRSVFR